VRQLLIVCAELNVGDVGNFRVGGGCSISIELDAETQQRKTSAVAEEQKSAVAEEALAVERTDNKDPAVADVSLESSVESMEALKWSTGLTDTGIIHGLLATLPEWSIKQQILAYRARDRVEKKQATEET
jgi:hypothetical protein